MTYSNDYSDIEYDDEEIEAYMDKLSKTPSEKSKKLRARRRIEEMREAKLLQQNIDSYYFE